MLGALSGFLFALGLLVLLLAVVHDPANRRISGRGNLDEVEVGFFGKAQGVIARDYTKLLRVTDEPDAGCENALVDAEFFWYRSLLQIRHLPAPLFGL